MVSSGVVEVGPFVPLLTALLVRGSLPQGQRTPPLLDSLCELIQYRGRTERAWKQDHQGFSYLGVPSTQKAEVACLLRSDVCGPDFQSNTVLFSDYDFCLTSC